MELNEKMFNTLKNQRSVLNLIFNRLSNPFKRESLPKVTKQTKYTSQTGTNQKEQVKYHQMSISINNISTELENEMRSRITKPVKVRQAKERDIPTLVNLYNRAFLVSNDPYSLISEDLMKKIFHFNNTIVFIGSLYGKDVGFIIIDIEEQNNEIGVISALGTLPQWRGRGVAIALELKSWELFKQIGVKEIQCKVYHKNDPSNDFLKSLGFDQL